MLKKHFSVIVLLLSFALALASIIYVGQTRVAANKPKSLDSSERSRSATSPTVTPREAVEIPLAKPLPPTPTFRKRINICPPDWNGNFSRGLDGWGGEWKVLRDYSKDWEKVFFVPQNIWQRSETEFHSAPFAAQVTIPRSVEEHQELHADLWGSYHFPVSAGQWLAVSAWVKGSAEIRLGVDFKRGQGPRDQVADVFTRWAAAPVWSKVFLDPDHPGIIGRAGSWDNARMKVPEEANCLAVWVQATGPQNATAYVDDIVVELLEQ